MDNEQELRQALEVTHERLEEVSSIAVRDREKYQDELVRLKQEVNDLLSTKNLLEYENRMLLQERDRARSERDIERNWRRVLEAEAGGE